jgi:hypothetical protein
MDLPLTLTVCLYRLNENSQDNKGHPEIETVKSLKTAKYNQHETPHG